ncbi:MAG: CDP-2,3-bis-(O-geranylgeranyl)-sn-glycerol synthase [Candidatus Korarchaeota archaeon]
MNMEGYLVGEYFLAVIGTALWYYLPAYFSNGGAVIGGRIWNKPIDGGKSRADGTRILGDGKTWGGLIFGTFVGFLVGAVELMLLPYLSSLNSLIPHVASEFSNVIEYDWPYFILIRATLAGFGALFGDIVKSYFKRKRRIGRGEKFFPWDQLDFILGSTLFMLPFAIQVGINFLWAFLFMIIVTPPIHLGVNMIAYKAGLKDKPW